MNLRRRGGNPKGKSMPVKELTISRQNIVDQVASFLYFTKVIPDNQEITNIQFSDLFGSSTTELCKIKVFIKEV